MCRNTNLREPIIRYGEVPFSGSVKHECEVIILKGAANRRRIAALHFRITKNYAFQIYEPGLGPVDLFGPVFWF